MCDNKVPQQLTQATFLYPPEKTVNMKIFIVINDLYAELPGL